MHEQEGRTLSCRRWGARHGIVVWIKHMAAALVGTVGEQSRGVGRPTGRVEYGEGETMRPHPSSPLQDPVECRARLGRAPSVPFFPPLLSHTPSSPCPAPPLPFPAVYRRAELDPLPFALKSHSALEIYCILIKLPEWETYENTIFVFYYVINLA